MIQKCCNTISIIFFSVVGIFGLHILISNTYQYLCVPSFNEMLSPLQITKYFGSFASPVCSGLIDLMRYTQNTYSMLVGAIFATFMSINMNLGNNTVVNKVKNG